MLAFTYICSWCVCAGVVNAVKTPPPVPVTLMSATCCLARRRSLAYTVGCVGVCACVSKKLENKWPDLDEIFWRDKEPVREGFWWPWHGSPKPGVCIDLGRNTWTNLPPGAALIWLVAFCWKVAYSMRLLWPRDARHMNWHCWQWMLHCRYERVLFFLFLI